MHNSSTYAFSRPIELSYSFLTNIHARTWESSAKHEVENATLTPQPRILLKILRNLSKNDMLRRKYSGKCYSILIQKTRKIFRKCFVYFTHSKKKIKIVNNRHFSRQTNIKKMCFHGKKLGSIFSSLFIFHSIPHSYISHGTDNVSAFSLHFQYLLLHWVID